MRGADIYTAKAGDLLRAAAATEDLGERRRLISEAVTWHMMASESEGLADVVTRLEESIPSPDFGPKSDELP